MYRIGDKVQAPDDRIGIIFDVQPAQANRQWLLVRFPDGSIWDGSAESFRAVQTSLSSIKTR